MSAAAWPALVKAALLGTDRTGRPSGGGGAGQVDVLVEVVVDDPDRSPERALLAAAAAVATARRAGRVAEPVAAELPAPAPPVDRPVAGEEAAGSLGALLDGTWKQLLAEWLEACGAGGLRVPPAELAVVLDAGTADRSIRPAVLAALGERGRWLAAQRAEWGWAVGAEAGEVPPDPVAAWAEGTAAERRRLLGAVRAEDPELGRSLLLSTWGVDRADDRAAFVELLGTGLSPDDEPFLEERALRDRGRDVRRAAAAMLARLPGSRLAARMQARTTAHVELQAGNPHSLVVHLPDDLLPEWEADGVDRRPRRGIGERAWWLVQLVASTPLDHWGAAADAILASRDPEHGEAVVRGWVGAAIRQARHDWAAALLAAGVPDGAEGSLLRVLDPPARAAWLAAALDRAPRPGSRGGLGGANQDPASLLGLAAEVPRPWPPALVRAVGGRAAAAMLGFGPEAHAARPALLLLAERADPSTLDPLARDLGQAMQADRRLEAELRRPLALVQLRRDLLAELAAPG